ncbi:DUF4424 family protein [Labrys portucalensis]|uniref:DUF4424 family protein n=1 Tax=Labrys neptuniae TaxID=376174 RepID=A0ABV6ZI61_9HYPH|nr:DUF4424 family protein [Labrys neptuniae]MDT3377943.1 DUF4424 family protein [Labrys neptuniae]
MPRFIPAIAVLAALLASPARADDTLASLDAGGLVLTKTDKIALVSEDLYLSIKAVKISYRFRNLTNADYEALVAFPMPDITGDGPGGITDIPDPTSDNFLKFTTKVDGKPVESQVEQRAFMKGTDGKPDVEITDRLKTLKIPMLPTIEATEKAINALSEADRKALADADIVYQDSYNADDKGERQVYYPLWTLRSKFWRKQVFPAGKDVIVQQDYVPSHGGVSSLVFGSPDLDAKQRKSYEKDFCTDAAFTKAAAALRKRASADEGKTFVSYEQYLAYVITSGGNWAGPIGDFRLVVDKGDPKTLVSFCGEGVKKIGPTTFEMVVKNYVPKTDIKVLLLVSEERK